MAKSKRVADCHPDKPHLARGMCGTCYRRWWNAENPGQTKATVAERRATGPRATCHPGRPVLSLGLCDSCYRAKWRAENPERAKAASRKSAKARYWRDPESARLRAQAARYGLTVEALRAMLDEQDGACAVCRSVRPLQVDHCHSTGAVRNLLCGPCNSALGYVRDNAATLRALADYAEAWSSGAGTPAPG